MTSYQKRLYEIARLKEENDSMKKFIFKESKTFFQEHEFLGVGRMRYGYVDENGSTIIVGVDW